MKNIYKLLAALTILLAVPALFTSCGDDDWAPGPPPSGWNDAFYDRALTGSWQLIQANGTTVTDNETNYLEFYGNGRGKYSYYQNGMLYSEAMGYWCEAPYGTYTDYQINIQYEYSSPVTMSYWFAGDDVLYLRWVTTNGNTVTYTYRAINYTP